MNNVKELHNRNNLPKLLSKETLNAIQKRMEASQPISLPKVMLDDLHNNISNPETIITLLGEQIITTHNLIMTLGLCSGLEVKNTLRDRLPATNAMVKLISAFSRQVELLEYLKDPNAKNIHIGRMNVSENGQAFVGNYSKT